VWAMHIGRREGTRTEGEHQPGWLLPCDASSSEASESEREGASIVGRIRLRLLSPGLSACPGDHTHRNYKHHMGTGHERSPTHQG
jgi:hypothetical protein